MLGLTRDFVGNRRSAPIRFRMRAAGGTAGGKTMAMECGSDTRLVARGVIRPFADKRTAAIWADRTPKGFPSDLAKVSSRKLRALAAAIRLEDLWQPPGNHLEALAGNRAGPHSVRVNDQWRRWRDGDACDVEIVDYDGG